MTRIPSSAARRTETPNAVMTTLASPTQGGAGQSLWRVEMAPGAVGPEHRFDVEQLWTVLDGAATIALGDGDPLALAAGDTAVLPAGVARRIAADPARGLTAIVAAQPGVARDADGVDHGVPAWIA